MKLTTLSSNSKGNCHILKSSNGKFCILDCGIKFKDITSSKEFSSFQDLDFVFSSHIHLDHSKSLKDFALTGVEIVSYENIEPRKPINIGQWTLIPFPVLHNVPNYGLIIYDNYEQKRIVYATDFVKLPKIVNTDYWIYEINYDEFNVNKIIEKQEIEDLHIANNVKYHNSLESAIEYFSELGNKPKLIIACHLSNMGGCEENILREMQPLCDQIEIAKKNKTIKF